MSAPRPVLAQRALRPFFLFSLPVFLALSASAASGPSFSPAPSRAEPEVRQYSAPAAQDILHHEPHSLESVGIYARHQVDFGVGMSLDGYHAEDVSTSVFDVLYLRLGGSLGYRFAPAPKVQLSVNAPFLYQLLTFSGTSGVYVDDVSSSGLGQVSVGGKVSLTPNFAAQGFIELPTGDTDADIPLGEGTNVGAMLLAEAGRGPVAIHAGAGLVSKAEYERLPTGATSATKIDPGDLTVLSVALTTKGRARNRRFGGVFQPGAVIEFNTYMLGDQKVAGATVADSGGTASNLLLGMTIGTRHGNLDTLAKLGFAFGVGSESHQSFDPVRGAGDFTYYGTVSTRWGRFDQ